MAEWVNKGNYMPGGMNIGSVIAAGPNTQATGRGDVQRTEAASDGRDLRELSARMHDLERALTACAGQLGEAVEPVTEQVVAVGEELAREKPRKTIMTSLLQGIAEHARAATGVVDAAQALAHAIGRLL